MPRSSPLSLQAVAALATAIALGAGGCRGLIGMPVTILDRPTVLEQQALGKRAVAEGGPVLLTPGVAPRTAADRVELAALEAGLEGRWQSLAGIEPKDLETRIWQAVILHNRAVLKLRLGERNQADELLRKALRHCTAYGLDTVRWQVMHTLGDVRGGEAGHALQVDAAEVLESAPLLSPVERELEDRERWRRLYAHLVAEAMLKQDPEAALEHALARRAVELARAGGAHAIRFPPGPMNDLVQDLLDARAAAAAARRGLCALPIEKLAPAGGPPDPKTTRLQERWAEARAALLAAREALAAAPAAGGLIVPVRADIMEVREILFSDTALLMLEPAGGGDYAAFLLTAEEFEARTMRLQDGHEAVLKPFQYLLSAPMERVYIVCPEALNGVDWDGMPLLETTLGRRLEVAFVGGPADLSAAFAAKSYGRRSLLLASGWPGAPEPAAGLAQEPDVTVIDARAVDPSSLARRAAWSDLLWLSNRVVLDPAEPARTYLATSAAKGRLGGVDLGALSALGSRASCGALANLDDAAWRPDRHAALRLLCRSLSAGGVPSVICAAGDVPAEVAGAFWDRCLAALRTRPAGAAYHEALRAVPDEWRRAFRLYGYLGMDRTEFAEYVSREYADREQEATGHLQAGRLTEAARALLNLLHMVDALENETPEARYQLTSGLHQWLVHCWRGLREYDRAARQQRILTGRLAADESYPRRALGLEHLSLGALLTQAERYEDAVAAYRGALALLEEHGRPDDLAEALGELGKSLDRATQYGRALESFELAIGSYSALEDEAGVAQQLQRIGVLYLKRLSNPHRAEEHFRKALAIYRRNHDALEVVDTTIDVAACRRRLGDLDGALRLLKESLEAVRAARPDPQQEAAARAAMEEAVELAGGALDEARRGRHSAELALEAAETVGADMEQSEGLLEERLAAEDERELDLEARTQDLERWTVRLRRLDTQQARGLSEMANTLWLQGRYQEALRNVWASNEIAGAAPDSAFRLNVNYQLLGLIYWELNEFERAHEALDEAVRQAWRAEMPLEAASAHNNRGIVFRRQKKYRQALASMDEALKIDERLRSRWGQGYDHRNIGITLHRMGYHEEAARHLETAVRLSGEIDDAVNLTRALYALGDLRLSQERLEKAEDLFTRALESARAVYMPEVEWRALRGLGLIRKAKGDRAGAIEHMSAAVEVVESVREGLKVEEFRSGFLTNKMDLYEDMVGLLLDEGRAEDALSYAERSRSRNFLDILARQSFELKTDRERRLYGNQRALGREIRSLSIAVRREKDERARAALAGKLQDRRKGFADLLVEIRAANPQLSSFVSVEVVPVRELAEALGEDVSLVVYYVMEDEVAIWVVRGGELTVRRVEVDRRRLTEQVRAYRLMVQRRELLDEVRPASQALRDLLLAPVEDAIAGSGAVGIVPHRALHYLSFASLYDGEEFLVERYPLFYAPSASVLARTLGRAGARPDEDGAGRRALRVLAVGNPAAGDPAYDLPFSEREVESLARDFVDVTLLVGEKATESWVAEHIGEFDVIHLAAHGYFDSVNPLFSALMLAPDTGAGDDGTLELHEVSGLEVNARLVVLSACQSALGDLRAGDELVSLSRAFMYAGTPAIISTLWRVDDVATALLAKHFYRQYTGRRIGLSAPAEAGLTGKAGLPGKAGALRAAQLQVMNDGKHYHPVYWAGMILTGDYR